MRYDVIDTDGYTESHWHFKTKREATEYAKMLTLDGRSYGIIPANEKRMDRVIWFYKSAVKKKTTKKNGKK